MNKTKRKAKRFINKRTNKAIFIAKEKNGRSFEIDKLSKRLKIKVIQNPIQIAIDAYKKNNNDYRKGYDHYYINKAFLIGTPIPSSNEPAVYRNRCATTKPRGDKRSRAGLNAYAGP